MRSPWFVLFIILMASMAAPLNQFKVPPVMPLLMEFFSVSSSRAGLLMSLFAFTGLILALPSGFIFQRLGPRATGVIAILSLTVGAALGIFGSGFETMLVSRFIEGAGMSLMSVVAPALIALCFSQERRGKAMGFWAIWVPLGSTIMFLSAPQLASRWGWQGVWWFGLSYALLAGLLYSVFLKPGLGHPSASDPPPNAAGVTGPSWRETLSNRDLWLISLLFCAFNFVFIAFITWAPTFLHRVQGIPLPQAAFLVSLTSIFSMIGCPTSGWISDRTGSRKRVTVIPMAAMAILSPLAFYAGEAWFFLPVILLGFIGGFVPTGVFAAGVEVVGDERGGGMAMAVIQIGQNTGMLLGPLVFGWVVESGGGWQAAFWLLVPVSILGALAGRLARIR